MPVISQTCGLAEWFVHGVHLLKSERTAEAFARVFAGDPGRFDRPGPDGPPDGRGSSVASSTSTRSPRGSRELLERAARRTRAGAGTAAEAYRLALLAEKLSKVLTQESLCA